MFILPQFNYSFERLQDLGGGVVISLQFMPSEPLIRQVIAEIRYFLVWICFRFEGSTNGRIFNRGRKLLHFITHKTQSITTYLKLLTGLINIRFLNLDEEFNQNHTQKRQHPKTTLPYTKQLAQTSYPDGSCQSQNNQQIKWKHSYYWRWCKV